MYAVSNSILYKVIFTPILATVALFTLTTHCKTHTPDRDHINIKINKIPISATQTIQQSVPTWSNMAGNTVRRKSASTAGIEVKVSYQ